jgi:aminopeptidase N
MADMLSSPSVPAVIRRSEYRPPEWLVLDLALEFDLDAALTRVHATLSVVRNGDHDEALKLDGDGLIPLEVKVDGRILGQDEWALEAGALVIPVQRTASKHGSNSHPPATAS